MIYNEKLDCSERTEMIDEKFTQPEFWAEAFDTEMQDFALAEFAQAIVAHTEIINGAYLIGRGYVVKDIVH